jgi:hypothetical protein
MLSPKIFGRVMLEKSRVVEIRIRSKRIYFFILTIMKVKIQQRKVRYKSFQLFHTIQDDLASIELDNLNKTFHE